MLKREAAGAHTEIILGIKVRERKVEGVCGIGYLV